MGIFGISNVVSPGTIQGYGGSTAPDGWLKCDGSAISRELYPELFAVIGTTYGKGDGETTFNIPNLIGLTSDNVPCCGNGMNLGLTNGELQYGVRAYSPGGFGNVIGANTGSYGLALPNSNTQGSVVTGGLGMTSDPSKSGVIASLSSASQKSLAIIKY